MNIYSIEVPLEDAYLILKTKSLLEKPSDVYKTPAKSPRKRRLFKAGLGRVPADGCNESKQSRIAPELLNMALSLHMHFGSNNDTSASCHSKCR